MSAPALTGILASLGAAPLTTGASAANTHQGAASRLPSRDTARSSFARELQQAQVPASMPTPQPTVTPPAPPPVATPHPPTPRADAGPPHSASHAPPPPAGPRTEPPAAERAPDDAAATAASGDISDPRSTAGAAARARARATRDGQRQTHMTPGLPRAAADDAGRSNDAATGVQGRRKAAQAAGDDAPATAPLLPQPAPSTNPPTTLATATPTPLHTAGVDDLRAAGAAPDAASTIDLSPTADPDAQDPSRPVLSAAADRAAADGADQTATLRAGTDPSGSVQDPAATDHRPPPAMLPPGEVTAAASAPLTPQADRLGLPESATGNTPALPSFTADMARAMAPPGASLAPAHPAPANVTLPTPVTAPEFVPRLSGELAVLARDGVQEARINVHPVELGPISVQIALDGTAAQVHLAVDNAQTRELLEQAMPSLAAALRENGLTLTGGGVFQQARQNAQDGGRDGARAGSAGTTGRNGSAASDADGKVPGAPPHRLRAVGALDVYA